MEPNDNIAVMLGRIRDGYGVVGFTLLLLSRVRHPRVFATSVLQPFQECHRERFLIEGPDEIFLDASHSLTMAMALHELATNAVKYGALSNRSG